MGLRTRRRSEELVRVWGWHMGWWWWAMAPLMVAFWGALIWLAVTLVRGSQRGGGTAEAERILAERYARGELEPEEYRRRRQDIRG